MAAMILKIDTMILVLFFIFGCFPLCPYIRIYYRTQSDYSSHLKNSKHIIGGLHIKMPDCICDVKTLKRSASQNREIINNATNKLIKAAHQLKKNNPPQEGINVFYHIAGLLGQRLWFYNKTRSYTDQLHIDPNACIGVQRDT